MQLAEKVGAEGVAGSDGVDHVDLAARHVDALFATEHAGAVCPSSDEHEGVLGPVFGHFIHVSSALVEPLDVFVAGLDDVAEFVDALNTNALVLGVEPESCANVDVVRDGDALGLLGPGFDHEVAGLHGHGEAAKLNALDTHVGELGVGWQFVWGPAPVGGAVDIERVGG